MKKRLYIHYHDNGDFTLTHFKHKPGTAFPEKEQRLLYINYELEKAIKHFRKEYDLKGVKLERLISGEKNILKGGI